MFACCTKHSLTSSIEEDINSSPASPSPAPPSAEPNPVEQVAQKALTPLAEELIYPGASAVLFSKQELDQKRAQLQSDFEGKPVTLKVMNHKTDAMFFDVHLYSNKYRHKNIAAQKSAALLSFGNTEPYENQQAMIQLFLDSGLSVMTYNPGGFSRSTGSPSRDRCQADIEATLDYLCESKKCPLDKVMLFARSISTGPAVHLASKYPIRLLLLDRPVADLYQLAKDHFPNLTKLPGAEQLIRQRYHFNTLKDMKQLQAKHVYIIRAKNDQLTTHPTDHASLIFAIFLRSVYGDEELKDVSRLSDLSKEHLLQMEGGHNDPWPASFLDEIGSRLVAAKLVEKV